MLNKILLFCIFLFFSPGLLMATPFQCNQELSAEQGERFLQKVQRAYSKLESLHAEFFQESYLFALDTSENSRGQMWFEKPGRTRWHYLQPEEQLFLLNQNEVWFYQPEDRQAMVDSVSQVFISELPVAFLMGMGNLAQDFNLISACKSETGIVFELEPASESEQGGSELSRFLLLASESQFLPVGTRIFDVGGNTTTILLEQLRPNIAIDKELFKLDIPANVDLDDRRRGPS